MLYYIHIGDYMFKKTLDNKKYHTLNYFYKEKFNTKVAKISLNGNFSCPNLDGKLSNAGCIYCSELGSGDFAGDKTKSITEQFEDIKNLMNKKWQNTKYIAYFQARTNTYAPLHVLKQKYEEALNQPNVIGLSIATRADSINEDVLDYLEELNKKTFLIIELGLQTTNEKTRKLINRCEELSTFEKTLSELQKRKIYTIAHIINGLPYETKEDMINTIKYLNKLNIEGVKIHMLHILKNTHLEKLYKKKKFHILTLEEYVDIVVDQLEYLNENITIHRITGDPKKEDLIEPRWLLKKFVVLNEIDKLQKKKNSYQGKNLK